MGILASLFKPNIKKLREKGDVDGLMKALTHKDWRVASRATTALEEIADESEAARDAETIRKIYHKARFRRDLRERAMRAMGIIKDKGAVELLIEIIHRPKDRPFARFARSERRLEAVVALGRIKDRRAVEPLIELFGTIDYEDYEDRPEELHDEAIKALVKMKKEALAPLVEALRHQDKNVRKCAAEALAEIRDERAVEPLIRSLRDRNPEVLCAAAEAVKALGKIKDERAVQALMERLRKGIARGDLGGLEILLDIGGETALGAVELLVHGLEVAEKKRVGRVVLALGTIAEHHELGEVLGAMIDTEKVKTLSETLEDQDVHVRSATVICLGKSKDEAALEPLIEALRDKDGHIRTEAVQALGEFKDERAVEPLIIALEIEEWGSTALEMIDLLGEIGDKRAVEALRVRKWSQLPLLYPWSPFDDQANVHIAAEEAIERIQKRHEKRQAKGV